MWVFASIVAASCEEIELLDAGAGETLAIYEHRLVPAKVTRGKAQSRRTSSAVYYDQACKEMATKLAASIGGDPAQLRTWKAPAGITIAAAELPHLAADKALLTALTAGDRVQAAKLLVEGVDADYFGKDQTSFIHLAAEHGDLESVRKLLDLGLHANGDQFDHQPPLHQAAKGGYVDVLDLLASKGARPAGEKRWTAPICYAVATAAATRWFLQHGAPATTTCSDEPLVAWAADKGNLEVLQMLVAAEPKEKAWQACALQWAHGERAVLDWLLQHGADPNGTCLHRGPPLTWCHTVECVEVLLANGAKIDLADHLGNTALHHNVQVPKAIALLLDKGANPNVFNGAGLTPLHLAALHGYVETTALLIKHKASLNARTQSDFQYDYDGTLKEGSTPLRAAKAAGEDAVADVLRAAGAK